MHSGTELPHPLDSLRTPQWIAAVQTLPDRPLGDILCDLLDAVDSRADLNVDVAIELVEEEGVVGYHPLVGDYLYHTFSLLAHLYLTGVTTIFWFETAILGVAVISLLSALQEWLWGIL